MGSVALFGRTDRHTGFGLAIWKERDHLEDLGVGGVITCNEYAFCAANMNDSVEIPTRCSFIIEFIIPKFIERSTCFVRHTAHHQEL